MKTIGAKPIPTQRFGLLEEFLPEPTSAYVFGTSIEDRSAHSASWEAAAIDVEFVRIIEQHSTTCVIEFRGGRIDLTLRSASSLRLLWQSLGREIIYLDITGLAHHVWAPLVKSAIEVGISLRVVYVEPGEYRFSNSPTEGEIFDLSEAIKGIAPLPGFTTLRSRSDDFFFVPLVGFEGARLSYVLEQVQPIGDKIVPVVGVPGFRPEYPFHTYLGNRLPFEGTKAWRNVYFARANCPFSLFYALLDIVKLARGLDVAVAPIGTKPHSLGAVLFHIASLYPVELIYDHPIRKQRRTSGSSRASIYYVSSFVEYFRSLNLEEL